MQDKADRIAMIREAAAKFKAKQSNQQRIKRQEQTIKDDADERHWTDAPQYVKEYYGETFRGTTRFDNDWG